MRLPRTHQSLTTLASSPTWGISQESATREPVLILAIDSYMSSLPQHRRIRLVAYGARLESVLGESPRGFESPILRPVMSHVIVDTSLPASRGPSIFMLSHDLVSSIFRLKLRVLSRADILRSRLQVRNPFFEISDPLHLRPSWWRASNSPQENVRRVTRISRPFCISY